MQILKTYFASNTVGGNVKKKIGKDIQQFVREKEKKNMHQNDYLFFFLLVYLQSKICTICNS
mgnify:CR=1 FL=1